MHADKYLTEDRQQLLSLVLARKGIERSGPLRLPRRAGGRDQARQSFAQQRLWLLDRLDPGAPTYNIPIALRIDGALDAAALERSLADVVARHEVLRTVFGDGADGPVQRILPAAAFLVAHEDLTQLDATACAAALDARIDAAAHQRFDLEAAPPLAVTLLRCGPEAHVLLIVMHHIVADGWSLGVLLRELGALYAAHGAGQPSPLPQLAIQYADFAEWERAGATPAAQQRQLDYWRGQLAGVPALAEFPTDRPRGAATGSAGASAALALPARLLEQVRRYAAAQGVTPFMVFLAAFKALVARHSGTSDIVVGTPVWNREHPDVEPLVGFFVNTLVLRTDLGGDPSFDVLLERVKATALGAFAHGDLPFEQLVDELGIERHAHEVPLLRMMFTLSQERPAGSAPDGLAWRQLDVGNATAKFDITMNVVERGDGASVVVEYKTGLFDAATIERLLGHFQQLLDGAAAHPETPLSRLPLLDAAELQDCLLGGRGAAPAAAPDVVALVAAQAARDPAAPALADGAVALSYGELEARANRLAHALLARGVQRGQPVALALGRSADMIVAALAALKAGAAFLPLDLAHPAERLAAVVADAAPALVVTRAAERALAPPGALLCLDADADFVAAQPAAAPAVAIGAADLAYVIYTSGSTGRPKGVEVTHGALANLVGWQRRAFAIAPHDRASQLAGPAFDATVLECWANLASGASVHVVADAVRMAPDALLSWLAAERITLSFMPTPLLEACLAEPWPAGMALRALFTGGSALRRRPPAGAPFKLYNMYGPTENAVVATCAEVAPAGGAAPSIGRPIDGVEVRVLDAHGMPVPAGVAGELHIGGRGLARGYRHDPAQTARAFVADPFGAAGARLYRSGDLVRLRADGMLDYLGRTDDQVKIRGYRIEPGDVEHALYQVDGIRRAAVLALENASGELCLAAFVELGAGSALQDKDVRQALRRQLPAYMVPALIQPLAQLPLTANGKIDKAALAAAHDARAAVPAARRPPATPLECDIAAIWETVLKTTGVDADANFFELGGNSLLATQVVGRLGKLLGRPVSLQQFFEEPTVAGLAAVAARADTGADGDGAPPLLPLVRSGPDDNRFPQSFAQQRLWFLEQLDPHSTTYNVPQALLLDGAFDVEAFQWALDQVVARHESLRTTFSMALGGERAAGAVQTVHPAAGCAISLANFETLPEAEHEARVRKLLAQETARPFDVVAGPLLRVNLVRLAATRHVLLINMHHLVTDAWSMGVFMRELSELYAARRQARVPDLAPLPVQYADFSVWQKEWLQFGVLEEMLYYWQGRLQDAPAALRLPSDKVAPAQPGDRAGLTAFGLGRDLSERLRKLSFGANATPFMVLLAGFKALLARYSGQADIVVGTPVAGRNREETENLIGFFVNTLVLRTDLAGDPGFGEIVARVRQTALDAFAHQDLPFERLVERLEPERRWGKSPLFNMMFVLQNAPDGAIALDAVRVQPLDLGAAGAKFDLTLTMQEGADGFEGAIEYRADLFDGAMVERLAGHFRRLLEAAVAQPALPLSRLALLDADERGVQLRDWRGAAAGGHEDDVRALVEAQAARDPAALALAGNGAALSYGELDARANRLAHALLRRGVQRGQLVAIALERSVDTAVACLAALKAGAAFLPLDLSHPAERLAGIVADAGVALSVTRAADRALAPPGALLCLDGDADAILAEPSASPAVAVGAADLAYVIYTSGSTGRPKGVEVTHGALANLVGWQRRAFAITPRDRASQLAGPAFDAALVEWWANLASGASVHVVDDATRMAPDTLIAWLAAERITLAFMPTPLLEASLAETWPAGMALRALFVGGAALRRRPPAGLPFKLYNMYGPTENAVVTTCAEITPDGAAAVPIGRPIDGVEVLVLDAHGAPVPAGVAGELHIGGRGLARGYRNDPAQTARAFVADPTGTTADGRLYRSGDLVRFRADGTLEFLGRGDDQVKIRGYRVELGEIEHALLEQAGVLQAAVVLHEDAGGQAIAAYVVAEEGAAPDADGLREALARRLPAYMVPAALDVLAAFPLTPNGKIDRRALPAPRVRGSAGGARRQAETEVEKAVVKAWGALLNYTTVTLDDNFFREGGHSLLALQLKAALHERFGVELALAAILVEPTPAALARRIEDALQAGAAAPATAPGAPAGPAHAAARPGMLARSLRRLKALVGADAGRVAPALARQVLVPLRPGDAGAPLFLVHPVGGTVGCYAELSAALPPGAAVYGLQAPAPGQLAEPGIEDLAALYVAALRTVQPQGPYRLGGWSLGGVVAFEMARQLRQAGADVATLVLFDSFPFERGEGQGAAAGAELVRLFVEDVMLQQGLAPRIDEAMLAEATGDIATLLRLAHGQLRSAGALPDAVAEAAFVARWHAYRALYDAWCCYTPKPYSGRLHLVMAADSVRDERRDVMAVWAPLAAGGLRIEVVPGDHYTILRGAALGATAGLVGGLLGG